MALNIIALVLVLAITFMHSIFGAFSGVINVCCSLFALAVAFGFWEPVSIWATQAMGLHPAYTEACVLMLLFFGTLTLLRYLADTFIRGNVRLPAGVDTGGAIVCGFINAQIAIGVLVVSVMLLPLGESTMGFRRYERTDEFDSRGLAKFERRSLWLRSDEFAVWIARQFSGGSLSAGTTLASVYPSYSDWLFYGANTVQWESSPAPYRDSFGDGVRKGLAVERWWEQTEPVDGRYRKQVPTLQNSVPDYTAMKLAPESGNKFVVAHLRLNKDSADREERRTVHVFRPTQLRLVGTMNDEVTHVVARIIGGADDRIAGAPRIADLDTNFVLPDPDATIEAYFEAPQEFKPMFVEYRRRARAGMTTPALASKTPGQRPAEAPKVGIGASGETTVAAGSGVGRGTTRFTDVLDFPSGDVWSLPFKVSAAKIRRGDVELDGDLFRKGRFTGERSRVEPDAGEERIVEHFSLPEGYRLCQIRYKPRRAASIVGQVFNYAAAINQYFAVDNLGEKHMMVGYYAIVKREGREHIELFCTGEYNAPGYNGQLDFKDIKPGELTGSDDAQVALFFYIPYGRTVRAIENQTGSGVTDIGYQMQSGPNR